MSPKKIKVGKSHLSRLQKLFPKVTKVQDAQEGITVQVTARDNRHGTGKDATDCAMARACKRTLKLDGCIISLGTAYTIKGDTATRYTVPQSLSREVVSFDRSKTFEPGTYSLSKVPPSYGRYQGPREKKGKPVGTRGFRHATTNVRKFPDRPVYGEESSDAS